MKIEKGILISVLESDIKDGVLNIPKKVKIISDNVCIGFESLKIVNAPNVTTIGNDCFFECNALTEFNAPNITTIGIYCFFECNALTEFNAPNVTTIGSYCFFECNALTEFNFGKNKMKIKTFDGIPFIYESSRTSKGIKIHFGYNFIRIDNEILVKQECYVSEKDGFFAHGGTLKKSISDLNFKIVSEKLKKGSINKDTLVTVKHYRLITGSCDLGCRNWLGQNNIDYTIDENGETIEKEPMKAFELLKILEKSNAYGVEKFKSLVTF